MMSLERMSSFLTSSPEEFSWPARPFSPAMPALRTARVMPLQAVAMAAIIMASSASPLCCITNCGAAERVS